MAWKKYEKILLLRSILAMGSRIIFMVVYTVMGIAIWQESEKYVENGNPENHSFAVKV